VRTDESGMVQRIERGGFDAEYSVDYIIGSGNAALGALVKLGAHLFQPPLTYYAKRGVWDIAPGQERFQHPDFTRPANHECLWCHSGQPQSVPKTINQYREPLFQVEAISCDRCHGPADDHLKSPFANTILNPVDLPPRVRDSVCEQCHLGGRARVLNPDRAFADFQPGMRLEDVFSVYMYDYRRDEETFTVVSHFEQLALSECKKASGEQMWCGTCHDPHDKPAEPTAHYRERCQSCHRETLAADHGAPSRDCVSCHMARRRSHDSGHSAFSDHRIAKRPKPEVNKPPRPPPLRAWREPEGTLPRRNLGLANASIGQNHQSMPHLREARRLLSSVRQHYPADSELLNGLGMSLMLEGKSKAALASPLCPSGQRLSLRWPIRQRFEFILAFRHNDELVDPDILEDLGLV
jgi:hypothetical protein